MPHSASSDLGLHCLSMSHKKDARHILVNQSSVLKFCSFSLFLKTKNKNIFSDKCDDSLNWGLRFTFSRL